MMLLPLPGALLPFNGVQEAFDETASRRRMGVDL
jgi:hypothetical protein